MTDLKTRITEDVKTAMKAGEKDRVSLLRMLTAELKQREVVEQIVLTDTAGTAATCTVLEAAKASLVVQSGAMTEQAIGVVRPEPVRGEMM